MDLFSVEPLSSLLIPQLKQPCIIITLTVTFQRLLRFVSQQIIEMLEKLCFFLFFPLC